MTLEHEIVFHRTPHDRPIESLIQERIGRLPHYYERLHGCRVVVETHEVKVELRVPGRDAVVIHCETTQDEPLATTVRDAFDAAERRLRDLHDRHSDVRR